MEISNYCYLWIYSFSFQLYQFLPYAFWGSAIIIVISSWCIETFSMINYTSLFLVIFLALRTILSDINIVSPTLLWLLFAWYIFLHHFTFNIFVHLNVTCISCRKHTVGPFYFYAIWSPLLLIGVFRIFTFSVIFSIGHIYAICLFVFYILLVFPLLHLYYLLLH